MKTKLIALVLAVPLLLVIFRCTGNNIAGNGTKTGNPVVAGVLYQPDGKTPAAGVRVVIRPKKSLADTTTGLSKRLAAVDSVTTDSAGRFAFDTTLDTGTYVITGASGNNAVLIDSVPVKSKTITDTLPPDTLKPAGALKGVIKLSEGGDARKVFVLIFGVDRFVKVDTNGYFKIAGLAEGKYDLRLISSLDNYGVLDLMGAKVTAGDTMQLDTIELPFTGIPTPKNVILSYDTLKQIMTLTWNKADTALVKGYNVYRRNVDSNTVLARINTNPVTVTVYRDSSGVQDQTYEYRVVAVDKNATEGTKSAALIVKALGMFSFVRTWGGLGSASGQMNAPVAIAADSRGFLYVADENNNRIQVFDSTGQYIRQFGNSILLQPCDVIAQDSFLFVATNGDKKVTKFLLQGDTLSRFNLPSNASFPRIAIDSNLNVYAVSNTLSGKLQVYDDTGKLLQETIVDPNICGNVDIIGGKVFFYSSRDSLVVARSLTGNKQDTIRLTLSSRPIDLAGDSTGIYILCRKTDASGVMLATAEVVAYGWDLQFLGRWGSNVQYAQVAGIAADKFGHVYIVDSDNRKIVEFKKTR